MSGDKLENKCQCLICINGRKLPNMILDCVEAGSICDLLECEQCVSVDSITLECARYIPNGLEGSSYSQDIEFIF